MPGTHVCFVFRRAFPAMYSTEMNAYPIHLAREGYRVTVLVAKQVGSQDPDHEWMEGVEVYRVATDLKTARSTASTLFGLKAFRLLGRLGVSERIDILHVLAFPSLGLALHPPPIWKTPPIKVLDIHATAVSSERADRISRHILRLQSRMFRYVVTLNEHVAAALFGRRREVGIVPLGADLTAFRPGTNPGLREELGVEAGELALIYVGNMHHPRRLGALLEAFHYATQKVKGLRLVMVGAGSDWERLKALSAELRLDNNVRFTGYVPFNKVPDYVRAADIGLAYVRNSVQYRDQPPIKTVEYLAAGLPVVGTATPGNRDFIENERNGLLAGDDPASYGDAIVRMTSDEELRRRLARQARDSVKEYDYAHIVARRLIPYYEGCIARERIR